MNELKPCPFCGGPAGVGRTGPFNTGHGESSDKIYIKCIACGVSYESEDYAGKDYEERGQSLVDKWNRRIV